MAEPASLCARIAQSACFGPLARWTASGSRDCRGDCALDPLSLLRRAARGEIAAQRELAEQAMCLVLAGAGDVDSQITLAEGLMFARMAAVEGDADDAMRVVAMLSLAAMLGEGAASCEYAGEAIARLELLADVGGPIGETAAELLAGCTQGEDPEALSLAKAYRNRLVDGCAVSGASVPNVPSVPEVS